MATPADYANGFIIFVVYNLKLSDMPAGEGDLRFTMYRKIFTTFNWYVKNYFIAKNLD